MSFSGIVTFKNAKALKEVAQFVPLDRLLIETDAPYSAPTPHRGRTNEPAYVLSTWRRKSPDLRDIPLETLIAATTNNFFQLFNQATR